MNFLKDFLLIGAPRLEFTFCNFLTCYCGEIFKVIRSVIKRKDLIYIGTFSLFGGIGLSIYILSNSFNESHVY